MSPTLIPCQQQQDKKRHTTNTTVAAAAAANDNDDCATTIDGIRFVDYVNESQLHHVMNLVGRDLSEPYSVFTYRYFLYRFPHLCILAVPDTGNPHEEPIGCVVGKIDEHDDDDGDLEQDDDGGHQDEEEYEHHAIEEEVKEVNEALSSSCGNVHNVDAVTTNKYDDDDDDVTKPTTTQGGTGGGQQRAGDNDTTTSSVVSERTTTGYIGMLAVSEQYRRRGIGKVLVHRVLCRMKELNCQSATLETEVTNTTAQFLYQDCFGFIREELLVRYYLNWNDAYRLRLWFD